jgi:hypothetical protein
VSVLAFSTLPSSAAATSQLHCLELDRRLKFEAGRAHYFAAAGAVARGVIRTHGGFLAPYIVFCAFCAGYSAVSGSLVSWGSAAAAGSGIPEIKTYLNGVHVPGKPTDICSTHGATGSVPLRSLVVLHRGRYDFLLFHPGVPSMAMALWMRPTIGVTT